MRTEELRSARGVQVQVLAVAALLSACTSEPMGIPAVSDLPLAAVTTATFHDDFDSFDPGFWIADGHPLGKGMLRPENVSHANGILYLKSPAATYDGAEIVSLASYFYGSYTARLRCGLPQGALCAFFLYQGVAGNRNDEIDIEILAGTRTIMLTTWFKGQRRNHASLTLPFDPAADFHDYRIEFTSTGLAFYVDGMLLQRFTKQLPKQRMKLLANAWWPTWLNGAPAAQDTFFEIDWIAIE